MTSPANAPNAFVILKTDPVSLSLLKPLTRIPTLSWTKACCSMIALREKLLAISVQMQ